MGTSGLILTIGAGATHESAGFVVAAKVTNGGVWISPGKQPVRGDLVIINF